jgi:hypothetical protein
LRAAIERIYVKIAHDQPLGYGQDCGEEQMHALLVVQE